jgi:hypothetical protein
MNTLDRPLKLYSLKQVLSGEMSRDLGIVDQVVDAPVSQPASVNDNVLAFAKVPTLGTSVLLKGQPFTLTTVRPYTRADGEPSQLLEWEAPCWECGEPFTTSNTLEGSSWLNRRCQVHRRPGARVRGVCHPPVKRAA